MGKNVHLEPTVVPWLASKKGKRAQKKDQGRRKRGFQTGWPGARLKPSGAAGRSGFEDAQKDQHELHVRRCSRRVKSKKKEKKRKKKKERIWVRYSELPVDPPFEAGQGASGLCLNRAASQTRRKASRGRDMKPVHCSAPERYQNRSLSSDPVGT
ncbi:hypothetical protein VTK73DRAFT_2142 [Phialemonium thermophilum]|uniref:Uncharacterized protein n=1 Tax=Phialemonium thermophilum TaxID=223376 RepID=A0ABR3VSK8_9PEZI